MIKYMFIIFLIVHLLSDFYFQTENMAKRKQKQFKWVLYHSIIYAVTAVLLFFIFLPGINWAYVLLFVLSHTLIDVTKYAVCKHNKQLQTPYSLNKRDIFLIDQILHLAVITIITYLTRKITPENLYRTTIKAFFDAFNVSELVILTWCVKLLLIHKPVNILISNILESYKPLEKSQSIKNDKNAGRFIGTLERIIMTTFISINQYSAVGLVLTAKSITRYEKISHEQDFAEYYLLGTLLSTISAICVSIII